MLDFSKLGGKRIPLEQKHIDAGIRGGVRHHPIALALNDVLDKDVWAEITLLPTELVFCTVMSKAKLAELYTTQEVDAWVWSYEKGEPVSAVSLVVFKDEDHHDDETDIYWLGLEYDHKTLGRVVNNQAGKEVETLLLCDQHLMELKELLEGQAPYKNLITIARHLKGICEVCATGDEAKRTPITYHPIPESITAHVVFTDGEAQTWEGHGGVGKLDYLRDNEGGVYTTIESLKARGVQTFTLENMHEVEVG